ncbi:MAG: bifunctional (p)ppGpp synthetase/guanosine-3',5'-bis(diphosphate) 3'-pyrophosphohydrolase [Ruminococcaceae bacterium]|nr:bifunctional (p)ppGpp synthetase/guanosine-3',5'-bis(diphosphate) 3'-pyrophosphohydrolase [Oscillospiraceae bacterium]
MGGVELDYFEQLKEGLAGTNRKYDIEKIKRAYDYADLMHEGQMRKSGEKYISHPVAVALLTAQLGMDSDSVCAALLHDTLEDCEEKVDVEFIKKNFGNDVLELVEGLTKLTGIQFEEKEDESIENLRKMFLAMSKDIRVIFIKLCDRLHNMRTLSAKSEPKQRMIALETMHVYAPLAHRLGIRKIKAELENLSLQYLDPIGYAEVNNDIQQRYGENKNFLENAQLQVVEELHKNNVKFDISGRVKTIYSIYKKKYNQNKSFDQIYDFYAMRIIVDSELDCYTVLGIIHENFRLIPGRFKDYISNPKPNLYRSLHTTVMSKHGIPFEVQIRTREMHEIAEYGLAAHWKYKSGESDKENISQKLRWIRTLLETGDDTGDADEFLRPLKIDLFEDETFVFTPKGDVVNLPSGSTPIDFAYNIHSAVGNSMIGAKVNGMIVPIDTVLETGQIVDVITSSASKGPSRDWLKIVKTAEAKNKIRQWFKREKRDENIIEGKNEVDKLLKRFGRAFTEQQRNEIVTNVSKRIGVLSADDFFNNIGYGGMSVTKYEGRLKDEFDRVVKPEISEAQQKAIEDRNLEKIKNAEKNRQKEKANTAVQSVIVDSIDNCQVRFAKCCNPLPGDEIIGFVTRGFGVSVHKYDCPNAVAAIDRPEEKDRWVSVRWTRSAVENTSGSRGFEALLTVYANYSLKLISEITGLFEELRVPVHALNTRMSGKDNIIINITVTTKGTDHLNAMVARIKKIKDVIDVQRGFS